MDAHKWIIDMRIIQLWISIITHNDKYWWLSIIEITDIHIWISVLETKAGPSVRDQQLLVRTRNFWHISLQINV